MQKDGALHKRCGRFLSPVAAVSDYGDEIMAKHTAADPTTRRTVSCGSTRRNSAPHRGHFPAMGSAAGCGGWKLAHGLDIETLPEEPGPRPNHGICIEDGQHFGLRLAEIE
jgi:hypothetical protein